MHYVWKKFNTYETNGRRKHELLTNINTNQYSSDLLNILWVTYDIYGY